MTKKTRKMTRLRPRDANEATNLQHSLPQATAKDPKNARGLFWNRLLSPLQVPTSDTHAPLQGARQPCTWKVIVG